MEVVYFPFPNKHGFCGVQYKMFKHRCVFMQLAPRWPLHVKDHAEAMIRAIIVNEAGRLSHETRYYCFVPIASNKFEFCEVVPDPKAEGVGVDFLHTACPPQVLLFYGCYVGKKPRQYFEVLPASCPHRTQAW